MSKRATEEIIDLFNLVEDNQSILLTFKLGDLELDIHRPKSLKKKELTATLKSQLLGQAILDEYSTLADEYNKLVTTEEGETLSRERLDKAFEIYDQMAEREIQLTSLSAEYIEILAKLPIGTLAGRLETEINKLYNSPPEISVFINQLFTLINQRINKLNQEEQTIDTTVIEEDEEKTKDPLPELRIISPSSNTNTPFLEKPMVSVG